METKFNFKSQPCTSRGQSKKLLALGLKKETADCGHFYGRPEHELYEDWETVILGMDWHPYWDVTDEEIPAWSLDRLLEILPHRVYEPLSTWDGKEYDNILDLNLDFDFGLWYKGSERHREFFDCNDLYDSALQAIEWLIKEGLFNKEYLV